MYDTLVSRIKKALTTLDCRPHRTKTYVGFPSCEPLDSMPCERQPLRTSGLLQPLGGSVRDGREKSWPTPYRDGESCDSRRQRAGDAASAPKDSTSK